MADASKPHDPVWSILSVNYQMAEREGDPTEMLGVLRRMAAHRPDDAALQELVALRAANLADSPAVVLIERVRTAGRSLRQPEGRVYIEEPDGRLRPADGEDLRRAEERFPGFIKNWKLPEEEG